MKYSVLFLALVSVSSHASGLFFGATSRSMAKNEFCSLNASVPQVLAAPGSGLENQARDMNARWSANLQSAVRDYEKTVKSKDTCTELGTSYQIQTNFRLETDLDADIVSIRYTHSSYGGGAHGNSAMSGETFNTKTGQVYGSLADFFDDSKLSTVLEKIEERLKWNEHFDEEFGWKDLKASIQSLSEVTNYVVTPYGIEVFYNQYEVGSYAEGPYQVVLSFEDLKEIGLDPNGAGRFLKRPVGQPVN